jgi:hypothetical protein
VALLTRGTHAVLAARRSQLVWLPSAMRMLAAATQARASLRQPYSVSEIDALLGCPLALPARSMIADGR